MPEYVYALHDFHPENEDEVSFHAGERVEVIEKDDMYQDGWWHGRNLAGEVGLFPVSYTAPAPPATDTSRAIPSPSPESDSHGVSTSKRKSVLHPLTEDSENGTSGINTPKEKYQQLKEDYYRIRDELKQARAINEKNDRELIKTKEELRKACECIGHLQLQLEDAKALSEVRGKELVDGSQNFLTKADALSISEVGDRVNALNEEIFQAAATLGDALIHKHHEVSPKDREAAAAVSEEMVGKKMTNTLIEQAEKSEVNPLLVQVVLQILMVEFCLSKIQFWYPGDSSFGGFLSAIYSEIRSTENQAVSGRWRALTRSHTRPSTKTWKKELYQKLQSILVTASWTARSSENEESYGNRLPSIFRAINELRTAMGENFISADLEILAYECDEIYDPREMEDAYGDGRHTSGKQAPEPIVGTTGIGLGKFIAEPNAKDAFNIQILTPANIVLTSTMNEALQPIQRKKMKMKMKPVDITDGANQDGRD